MTNPKDEFPRRTENKRDRGAIENAEMRVICVGMLRQRDRLGKIDFLSCGRSLATRKDASWVREDMWNKSGKQFSLKVKNKYSNLNKINELFSKSITKKNMSKIKK